MNRRKIKQEQTVLAVYCCWFWIVCNIAFVMNQDCTEKKRICNLFLLLRGYHAEIQQHSKFEEIAKYIIKLTCLVKMTSGGSWNVSSVAGVLFALSTGSCGGSIGRKSCVNERYFGSSHSFRCCFSRCDLISPFLLEGMK